MPIFKSRTSSIGSTIFLLATRLDLIIHWTESQIGLSRVYAFPDLEFSNFQYFVKVVGTDYRHLNGTLSSTNQFAVTEHARDVTPRFGDMPTGMPGVFMMFEISSMRVTYTEFRKPLSHFLTDLCAIIGGVVTVAGVVDAMLFSAMRGTKNGIGKGA